RAGIGLTDLFDHPNIGRQVELAATERARNQESEQSGVRERLEERPRQLARLLDLVGVGANDGSKLPRYVERRTNTGIAGHHLARAPRLIIGRPVCPSSRHDAPAGARLVY